MKKHKWKQYKTGRWMWTYSVCGISILSKHGTAVNHEVTCKRCKKMIFKKYR